MIEPLQQFEAKLAFPLVGPAQDSVGPLLRLIEEFSVLGDAVPWCMLRYHTVGEWSRARWEAVSSPVETIHKFLTSVARSECVGRDWRDSDDFLFHDGIGLGRDEHFGLLEVTIQAVIDPNQQELFFLKLCELLGPGHCAYISKLRSSVGWQEIVLESALERDYAMYGDLPDSPQVILAKSIAPLLPRMPFAVPDPMGLPSRLGWLNYWHADVATGLGFPDASKDADLLQSSYRTPSGAWMVKLTEDSLDLTRPDHVEALARAYWRFDKIGKRMQPTTKKAKPRVKRSEASAEGLNAYVVRERDEAGNWWIAAVEPIRASSAEEALRIHLAKTAHGRAPRPSDSLAKLRKAYDGVAFEVGLTTSENIDVVEAGSDSDERLE